MAKGNLFLGTARGSVGDVTMYQNRGQQAARVRKRVIANPESDRQIVTRAILSTVAKAYSAGRAIFDHSFEGYKRGQANQDRFSKLNISALRAAYNEDISTEGRTAFQCKGRFCQKNAVGPVAFSFIVSEGSLSQNFMFVVAQGSPQSPNLALAVPMPNDETQGQTLTVAEYLSANSIQVGDIFTLVGLGYNDYNIYSDYDSYYAGFQFIRFKCNPSAAVLAQKIAVATWADVFDVDFNVPMPVDLGGSLYAPLYQNEYLPFGELGLDTHGAFGIIRSRDDRDLRSSCVLTCTFDLGYYKTEEYQWGLTSLTVTNGWRSQSPEAEDSPLILEGGNVAAALDEIGKE